MYGKIISPYARENSTRAVAWSPLNPLLNTMPEPSSDLDESYDEHDRITEQMGITEALLLQDDGPEISRRLPYLLVLTCGGAG